MVRAACGQQLRRLTAAEEEAISGMPPDLTLAVNEGRLPSEADKRVELERKRKSLIGNAWHFAVARFLLLAILTADGVGLAEAQGHAADAGDPWRKSWRWARVNLEPWWPVFERIRRQCLYIGW